MFTDTSLLTRSLNSVPFSSLTDSLCVSLFLFFVLTRLDSFLFFLHVSSRYFLCSCHGSYIKHLTVRTIYLTDRYSIIHTNSTLLHLPPPLCY